MEIIQKHLTIILSILMMLLLCSCNSNHIEKVNSSEEVYIPKIDNISDDFIMGMDLSSIISLENSGVRFYDFDGKKMKAYGCYDKEMMRLLKKIGWEFIFVSADLSGYRITEARISDIKEKLRHKTNLCHCLRLQILTLHKQQFQEI